MKRIQMTMLMMRQRSKSFTGTPYLSFFSFFFLLFLSFSLPSFVFGDFQVSSITSSGSSCVTTQNFGDLASPSIDEYIGGPVFVGPTNVYNYNRGSTMHIAREPTLKLKEPPLNSIGLGILSDISNGNIWILTNDNYNPIYGVGAFPTETAHHLARLDPITGGFVFPLDTITLDTPIPIDQEALLLSGYGVGMVIDANSAALGNGSLINLTTGSVSGYPYTPSSIPWRSCGKFGYGILETVSNTPTYSLLITNGQGIYRYDSSGTLTLVLPLNATAVNVCSFTVNGIDTWVWTSGPIESPAVTGKERHSHPSHLFFRFHRLQPFFSLQSQLSLSLSLHPSFFFTVAEVPVGYFPASFTIVGNIFVVDSLLLTNGTVEDLYNFIGRDPFNPLHGIPVSFASNSVMLSGYWGRIFSDLLGKPLANTLLPFPAYAVITDYETGFVWCLAHGAGCITSPRTTAHALRRISPTTGKIDLSVLSIDLGVSIQLSLDRPSILASGFGEFFAWYGDATIASGYRISFSDGTVKGTYSTPYSTTLNAIQLCYSGISYGVLERDTTAAGNYTVLIATTSSMSSYSNVFRWNPITDSLDQVTFSPNITGLCSFTLDIDSSRWLYQYGMSTVAHNGATVNTLSSEFKVTSLQTTNPVSLDVTSVLYYGPLWYINNDVALWFQGDASLESFLVNPLSITPQNNFILPKIVITDFNTQNSYAFYNSLFGLFPNTGPVGR
jgi:hypothetical protein